MSDKSILLRMKNYSIKHRAYFKNNIMTLILFLRSNGWAVCWKDKFDCYEKRRNESTEEQYPQLILGYWISDIQWFKKFDQINDTNNSYYAHLHGISHTIYESKVQSTMRTYKGSEHDGARPPEAIMSIMWTKVPSRASWTWSANHVFSSSDGAPSNPTIVILRMSGRSCLQDQNGSQLVGGPVLLIPHAILYDAVPTLIKEGRNSE